MTTLASQNASLNSFTVSSLRQGKKKPYNLEPSTRKPKPWMSGKTVSVCFASVPSSNQSYWKMEFNIYNIMCPWNKVKFYLFTIQKQNLNLKPSTANALKQLKHVMSYSFDFVRKKSVLYTKNNMKAITVYPQKLHIYFNLNTNYIIKEIDSFYT